MIRRLLIALILLGFCRACAVCQEQNSEGYVALPSMRAWAYGLFIELSRDPRIVSEFSWLSKEDRDLLSEYVKINRESFLALQELKGSDKEKSFAEIEFSNSTEADLKRLLSTPKTKTLYQYMLQKEFRLVVLYDGFLQDMIGLSEAEATQLEKRIRGQGFAYSTRTENERVLCLSLSKNQFSQLKEVLGTPRFPGYKKRLEELDAVQYLGVPGHFGEVNILRVR